MADLKQAGGREGERAGGFPQVVETQVSVIARYCGL
jgi:hypothetical protein